MALLLLIALGGGGAAAFFLLGGGIAGSPTPTPSPSLEPSVSAAPSESEEPGSSTPFPETPVPDPTPRPGDVFVGYEVTVLRGDYTIYLVDENGSIVHERPATFSDFSRAQVEEVTAPNDLHHWRTLDGDYTGYSYIHGFSGPFLIREVYEGDDGVRTYIILPDDRL